MKTLSQELRMSLLAAEFKKLLGLPCTQPRTSIERLQGLFHSVNTTIKELYEADQVVLNRYSIDKDRLTLDLFDVLHSVLYTLKDSEPLSAGGDKQLLADVVRDLCGKEVYYKVIDKNKAFNGTDIEFLSILLNTVKENCEEDKFNKVLDKLKSILIEDEVTDSLISKNTLINNVTNVIHKKSKKLSEINNKFNLAFKSLVSDNKFDNIKYYRCNYFILVADTKLKKITKLYSPIKDFINLYKERAYSLDNARLKLIIGKLNSILEVTELTEDIIFSICNNHNLTWESGSDIKGFGIYLSPENKTYLTVEYAVQDNLNSIKELTEKEKVGKVSTKIGQLQAQFTNLSKAYELIDTIDDSVFNIVGLQKEKVQLDITKLIRGTLKCATN